MMNKAPIYNRDSLELNNKEKYNEINYLDTK